MLPSRVGTQQRDGDTSASVECGNVQLYVSYSCAVGKTARSVGYMPMSERHSFVNMATILPPSATRHYCRFDSSYY